MTEPRDWLDEALARHEREPVPPDFQIRLMGRIRAESSPRIRSARWARLAAAALLILAAGYWMGMGAPSLSGPTQVGRPGDLAALELSEIYANREMLEAWELLEDPELELGFGETQAGAWAYGLETATPEEPR